MAYEREWIVTSNDIGCDGEYFDYPELIRCKDCSNWDKHWVSSLFSENVHYCAFMDGPCSGDFYCGAAIKRPVLGGDTR